MGSRGTPRKLRRFRSRRRNVWPGTTSGGREEAVVPVDQLRSVSQVEERLARTEDPRQRGMLATVAAHLRAEAGSDLDGLRATLVDEPDYHLWADGRDYGPKGMDA